MLRISNVAPLRVLFFRLLIFRQFTRNLATGFENSPRHRPFIVRINFPPPRTKQAFIAIKLEPLIRAQRATVFSSQASHKNLPHWKRDFSSLSRSEQPGITKSNRKGTTLTTLGNVKRVRFILSWLLTSFSRCFPPTRFEFFESGYASLGELASCCKITRLLRNRSNINRSIS